MVQFHIQPDSDIPASTQLYNQILFAIASRQFPPGHRLPSTRQLAMQTGLHRNTISKVYRQLEDAGVVDAQAGSGIYVRDQGHDDTAAHIKSPLLEQYPQAHKIIQTSLDELVKQGCSLGQARELFLAEIDWRLRCSASVLVTAPLHDIANGEVLMRELERALAIPMQLVPMEELAQVLDQTRSSTVVTSRYFIAQAEAIAMPKAARVIPVDIYDFEQELKMVKTMPKGTCLGIVSLSAGTVGVAEVIIHSLRGDDLLVMTAQVNDRYKLNAMVRTAQTIFSFDHVSCATVKATISASRDDIIRPPQVICCENFIVSKSISLLKRELGLE
ncbi:MULTISPECIES: GntR family transcriptional regulator [Leptolyngbya]|jgi:GntR family transcriptional regulator|uniref:GntR family transcriptional regulator n=2 Tax=Leptolyngbya boryana TaxID=1184 RepID=A0A1Z4J9Z6_LEPBY|nr:MULTISPECIES: GntR family transcriptional regulator [Leptolyngbya]BAY53582.1 GntR family transcriptional regulator [Leptolyngbya boryana NIES-2135]MBD1855755.1 GntR family transcriptional regulator [Leptolyngbya sp. FACHB-1624]MBD2366558.1 GntR family transcriptional regulator [Leptolyngbya sp. FACHB-161]MBD2397828.1 GntR family transcriptional regulator [Leptolyngbya sp. FACHB-239]MBD2407489.1 GntR family transcriptional regulator [Leptolyngbya sp. FACHB-402]